MKSRLILLTVSITFGLFGQRVTGKRSADIRGGSGGDGKCTVEVYVDDVAEVEIRGRNATIRTFSGSPASIRRFECNEQLPYNPSDFRFKGVDGRGRQELVRSPDRGSAIIRIEDSKGGSEGYTFDLFWRGGGGYNSGGYGSGGYSSGGYGSGGSSGGSGYNNKNNGWDNGWGNGSGWTTSGNFDYKGGRQGSGAYRDRDGNRRRLDAAHVFIGTSGIMAVSFGSDRGKFEFMGKVDRRDGRTVFAEVNGNGARGTMEIEMSSHNTVRKIYLREIDLEWRN